MCHLSKPQSLHLLCESLSATWGCFKALMRKWDTASFTCAWPLGSPRLCKCHPTDAQNGCAGSLRAPAHLGWGAVGPPAQPSASLSLSIFIL